MKKIIFCLFALSLYGDVYEVTQGNYSSVVEQSSTPVIVDVYATWCPPCQRMGPLFEAASERYPNIRFVKIDCDKESELARRLHVDRLPTLLFFLPGKSSPSLRSTGGLSEQALDDKINKLQELHNASG